MIETTHKDWPEGPKLAGWRSLWPFVLMLDALQVHLAAHISDVKLAAKLARLVAKVAQEHVAQARYNLNLQIREFVLSCPKRRAFVRGVIGERAIKRWKIRFKNSFEFPAEKSEKTSAKARKAPKSYTWKPYALPPIDNIFRGMSFDLPAFPDFPNFPELPSFSARVRGARGFAPAVFWPRELRPNYQHVRETPDPVDVRESARLRAAYYEKHGRSPDVDGAAENEANEAPPPQARPP